MSSTRAKSAPRHALTAASLFLPLALGWSFDAAAQAGSIRHYQPAQAPSFDCREAASPVQDFICASDRLAALDSQTAELFRSKLHIADLFGRDQLLAGQRRWVSGRSQRCAVPPGRQTADRPDPAVTACLEADYRERQQALQQWQAASRTTKPDSDHPLSAYIQFTAAQSLDAAFCERFRESMNAAIKRTGEINVAHLPGVKLIAGSHGPAEVQQPLALSVIQRDAGPYGSYEIRATGLKLGASQVIDAYSLGRWIGEQPNNGGRPSALSSQTNDYGALDVFSQGGQLFALVAESWGYYTPAASGESAYAGLYALDGGNSQRRCLFKTYLKPPVRSVFAELPAYNALLETLEQIRASEPSGLEAGERRDETLLRREQQWQLLNTPLLHTIQARQFGWSGWLRRRHDITLDRLFAWSEGSLGAKQLYRSLLSTLKPAIAEAALAMRQTQGLSAEEATQAGDLLAMELLDHALGPVVDNSEAYTLSPASQAKYPARFPVLAQRSDLEKGRPLATLYGAVLNRLPAKAVGDFIAWEKERPEKRSLGRQGETPLAAAVLVGEHVELLLAGGADPNEADRFGFTPLMQAARFARSDSVTRLLAAGARIDARTQDIPSGANEPAEILNARAGGKTALHFAAQSGDAATIQSLLEQGARTDSRDNFGTRPCDLLKLNLQLAAAEQTTIGAKLCPATPTYAAPTYRAPAQPEQPSASARIGAITIDAERPRLQVGESWKIETRNKNTNILKQVDEMIVTAIAPERITLSINGQPGSMSPELAALDGPKMRYDEGYRILSFPLQADRKWSMRTGWEHRERGARGQLQLDVQVKGEETLKLAWGEVPTIKLEAQGILRVESPIRLMRRVSASYWYAPSAKAIVRTEWLDGAEDLIIEVVAHSDASRP